MTTRKTLALIQYASYRSYPVGGISMFVESILPYLDDAFHLKLIGMSRGEPIGEWTRITAGEREYEFLPVVSARPSQVIPDRVRLAYALKRHQDAVLAAHADGFYVHMTEAAISLMMMSRRPIVIHVHGLYNLFRFSRHWLGPAFATIYEKFYPQLFSRCAKVIGAGTEAEFENFRRAMRVEAGVALPTCVREDIFYPRDRAAARREMGIRPDETVLLYAGRMTDTKNPLLLIQAGRILTAEVPNFKLVFAGDGPMREELEHESSNMPNVVIAGILSANETALWMNAADALAVVSKTEAFTSIVALEALSCGTPVVATPVSALPDMIHHGVNGAVSQGFEPEQYAEAVRKVLRARPSREACRRTASSYTSAAVALRVVDEINEVLH